MTIAIWRDGRRQPGQPEVAERGDPERFGERGSPGAPSFRRAQRQPARRIGRVEAEALDQPRHGQPLDEDRESDDDERRDDDRAALGNRSPGPRGPAPGPARRAGRPRTRRAGSGAGRRQRERAEQQPRADRPTGRGRRARAGSRPRGGRAELAERLVGDVHADQDEHEAVGEEREIFPCPMDAVAARPERKRLPADFPIISPAVSALMMPDAWKCSASRKEP